MQGELITYIHEGNEVVLTGRYASNKNNKRIVFVEIVPVGTSDINDRTYAKWVNKDDLFTIAKLEDMETDDET